MDALGYDWVEQHLGLPRLPRHLALRLGPVRTRTLHSTGRQELVLTAQYNPGSDLTAQLLFGLKWGGVELPTLAAIFHASGPAPIIQAIQRTPTGGYARRLAFLYEFITAQQLPEDLGIGGNYVPALPPEDYAVSPAPVNVPRWRVLNNLLGGTAWCPTVRRSPALDAALDANISGTIEALLRNSPPELVHRAAAYLCSKETRSTYAIEREDQPPADRTERFVQALMAAGTLPADTQLSETALADLQSRMLDPRYASSRFRSTQNYVGQSTPSGELVHYACPPPEDVAGLMQGLATCAKNLGTANALLVAAVTAFGFVFIHPFEDGNGRTHRFLIHDALVRGGVVPRRVIVPVSATMLANMAAYDAALEDFSKPLMGMAHYALDAGGELRVTNPTVLRPLYRFPDLTAQTLYLAQTLEHSVRVEFANELRFLAQDDEARRAVRAVVDMPDRKLDMFIRLVQQNRGVLAARKREQFPELTTEEVSRMEEAVRSALEIR